MGGPGTLAEARAMAAACSPAARAAESWAVAKNPQEEPMSARTPTPACSPCSSDSIVWLRASRLWVRLITTRASAYSAPAARAPSTAPVAAPAGLGGAPDAVAEAVALGLGRPDPPARQHQIEHLLGRHGAQERHRDHVGPQADVDLGGAEGGVVGGDHEVAGQGQAEAAGQAVAPNPG